MTNSIIEKLKQHEGELFHTVKNLPFTYRFISNNSFVFVRDGRDINRVVTVNQVIKAIELNPQRPIDICYQIVAGSYIFALIKDPRFQ